MVLPDGHHPCFRLSVGPQPQLLARIAPGIIQVAALLASLLALERLFRD
ncbi:heme exporter protein CcmB, partial [Salmonella enterica]